MGMMRERLVWLPVYVLGCAVVGILAYFATYNNLKVGLVTAALGAVFGALGWLAMQIPQRRVSCLDDHLTHMEMQIEKIDKALQAREAYFRFVLGEVETALERLMGIVFKAVPAGDRLPDEYIAAQDVLVTIRKAMGK